MLIYNLQEDSSTLPTIWLQKQWKNFQRFQKHGLFFIKSTGEKEIQITIFQKAKFNAMNQLQKVYELSQQDSMNENYIVQTDKWQHTEY